MSEIAEKGFVYSIPEVLHDKVKFSKIYVNYGVMEKETTFGIDLSLTELRLNKSLRSRDLDLLPGKVEETLHRWEAKYDAHLEAKEKEEKFASAEEMSKGAQQELNRLSGILAHTLDVHDAVDWAAIRISEAYRTTPENLFDSGSTPDFIEFDDTGKPTGVNFAEDPAPPTLEGVAAEQSLITRWFRKPLIESEFQRRNQEWADQKAKIESENQTREQAYKDASARFQERTAAFEEEKQRNNKALADIEGRYQTGDQEAVEEYCDLVLSNSAYPDYFPRNWFLELLPQRLLVVAYQLPVPEDLPDVESYRYDDASDKLSENRLQPETKAALYDSAVFQICVRTIHELLEADVVSAIDSVVFNGFVESVDPATGKTKSKTIVSVRTDKEDFNTFDLARVDPKATFDHLGGVCGSVPHEQHVVDSIVELSRVDRRFLD